MLTNRNLSFLYDEPLIRVNLDARFALVNDTIGQVVFKINSRDLLYVRQDSTAKFEAKYLISYCLFKSYDSKVIVDSGKIVYSDFSYQIGDKDILNSFNVNLKQEKLGVLELTILDLAKQSKGTKIIDIDLGKGFTSSYFKISNTDRISYLKNYVEIGSELKFQTYKADLKSIFVKYYSPNFPIALPPYTVVEEKPYVLKPDSVWQLNLANGAFDFRFEKKGIYYFQADTTIKSGLTMSVYPEDFPQVSLIETVLPPMRYLTTKQEYDKIISNPNLKEGIDDFWLSIAGNPDRAREIIRAYFTQVSYANEYFSSYVEGWKTDRGLIYIIFGAPNIVFRNSDSETWIYGEQFNVNSLTFKFYKMKNPFTDNDFMLNRSPLYRQNWFNAVDMWRK